jgi:hypothetical protein
MTRSYEQAKSEAYDNAMEKARSLAEDIVRAREDINFDIFTSVWEEISEGVKDEN